MDECSWKGCREKIKHKCNDCINSYCQFHAPGCFVKCTSGCDRVLCLKHFDKHAKYTSCKDCEK